MRGYAALGVEGVSKMRNAGAVIRTAHAFSASFAFLVGSKFSRAEVIQSDTSKAVEQLPFYQFDSADELRLPHGCQLVGIELTENAHLLPSFRHPRMAAYVLGSERMGLSDAMLSRCDHVIQIPTRFSLNLAVAGALVLYDRLQTMERFAPRPLMPGGATEQDEIPPFGDPLWVKKHKKRGHSA
jgi:tRNA G18 (ribose-2'-O)-methylase SpoU